MAQRIQIDTSELEQFVKELAKAKKGFKRRYLKRANSAVARLISSRAKGAASTRQEAKAAETLRGTARGTEGVIIGGGRLPWFYGAELGARRFKQFKPWRGTFGADAAEGDHGYFLFPTIRESLDDSVEIYRDAVLDAFPDG